MVSYTIYEEAFGTSLHSYKSVFLSAGTGSKGQEAWRPSKSVSLFLSVAFSGQHGWRSIRSVDQTEVGQEHREDNKVYEDGVGCQVLSGRETTEAC